MCLLKAIWWSSEIDPKIDDLCGNSPGIDFFLTLTISNETRHDMSHYNAYEQGNWNSQQYCNTEFIKTIKFHVNVKQKWSILGSIFEGHKMVSKDTLKLVKTFTRLHRTLYISNDTPSLCCTSSSPGNQVLYMECMFLLELKPAMSWPV